MSILIIHTRSGAVHHSSTDKCRVLLPDNTKLAKPASDLAVGDILLGRGRITAIAVFQSTHDGGTNGDTKA